MYLVELNHPDRIRGKSPRHPVKVNNPAVARHDGMQMIAELRHSAKELEQQDSLKYDDPVRTD